MMTIDPAKYISLLCQMMLDISAIGIVASIWTGFVFITSGNWRKVGLNLAASFEKWVQSWESASFPAVPLLQLRAF